MPNIVITHAFGPQNRGDHELLERLIGILRVATEQPQITVLTRFPEESRDFFPGCRVLHTPIYRREGPAAWAAIQGVADAMSWVAAGRLPALRSRQREHLATSAEALEQADLILMCPGGYLYSNGSSLVNNLLTASVFPMYGKPFALAPMSIGPFTKQSHTRAVGALLQRAAAVFVRESYSYELAQRLGAAPVLSMDLALWRAADESIAASDEWAGRYVGTVLDWHFPEERMGDPRQRYFREFLRSCRALRDHSGERVVLYRQVSEAAHNSKDVQLLRRMAAECPDVVELCGDEMTPATLRSRIAGSRGVLASRFHSALFAMQAGVPFIALAYQPKSEFILKDLGLSEHQRNMASFEGAEVAGALIRMDRTRTREVLVGATRKASDMIEESFVRRLPELLSGASLVQA